MVLVFNFVQVGNVAIRLKMGGQSLKRFNCDEIVKKGLKNIDSVLGR